LNSWGTIAALTGFVQTAHQLYMRALFLDALPWANPCFAEESLRDWSKPNSLPDKALVLCVCAAK